MQDPDGGQDGEKLFSYRPAPMQQPVEIRVRPDEIAAGGQWRIRLADLDEAAFTISSRGDSRMVRLDLYSNGSRRSLSFNGSRRADNENARQHLAAVIAALRAIAAARPQIRVVLGAVRGANLGMFLAGLTAILIVVGISIAVFVAGVSADRLQAGAGPIVMLTLMGAALMAFHWPWRRRRKVEPEALADLLASRGPNLDARLPANMSNTPRTKDEHR